jgi:thiol-disulfide isomerase/thioredoxin
MGVVLLTLFFFLVINNLFIVEAFAVFPHQLLSLSKNSLNFKNSLTSYESKLSNRKLLQLYGGKSSSGVIEIESISQLEEILSSAERDSKLVVLDFTATWCGPCKHISPVFAQFAESNEFDGKAIFAKVIHTSP